MDVDDFTIRSPSLYVVSFLGRLVETSSKHVVLARDMQDGICDLYSDVRPLYETSFGSLLASHIASRLLPSDFFLSCLKQGGTQISPIMVIHSQTAVERTLFCV
ncbi:hypothetical protein ARMGADRAFT_1020392 [Armillaria gallica]|uniref:Uncharacterized protein n=1 Tax=Armillaria gallica TaxID=47427 RepID=A0A2H3CPW5_ARMGA|nr:hypothetical protein ARMGADRAFT_1020392 [Armillaria gallica]